MDTMIREILINTYNADPALRHEAENAFAEFLRNHGSFSALLAFVQNQSIERDLKVAAAIALKNNARKYFRDDQDESILPISPEEKESVKTGMCLTMIDNACILYTLIPIVISC